MHAWLRYNTWSVQTDRYIESTMYTCIDESVYSNDTKFLNFYWFIHSNATPIQAIDNDAECMYCGSCIYHCLVGIPTYTYTYIYYSYLVIVHARMPSNVCFDSGLCK